MGRVGILRMGDYSVFGLAGWAGGFQAAVGWRRQPETVAHITYKKADGQSALLNGVERGASRFAARWRFQAAYLLSARQMSPSRAGAA